MAKRWGRGPSLRRVRTHPRVSKVKPATVHVHQERPAFPSHGGGPLHCCSYLRLTSVLSSLQSVISGPGLALGYLVASSDPGRHAPSGLTATGSSVVDIAERRTVICCMIRRPNGYAEEPGGRSRLTSTFALLSISLPHDRHVHPPSTICFQLRGSRQDRRRPSQIGQARAKFTPRSYVRITATAAGHNAERASLPG